MYDAFCFLFKTSFFGRLGTFFGTFSIIFLSKEDFAFKIKESFIRIKVNLFRYDLRELIFFGGGIKKKKDIRNRKGIANKKREKEKKNRKKKKEKQREEIKEKRKNKRKRKKQK